MIWLILAILAIPAYFLGEYYYEEGMLHDMEEG